MADKENIKANGTILLVEDEANIAKLYHYNLTKAGFYCEVAKNGEEGFQKARSIKPDLIISDIMMPNVDGYEFRKMLLADSDLKTIPFIFLTAKGEEESILQGYELEIEDYLIKTSSPKIIIAKVTAILKSLEKERGKVVGEVQKAADTMGAKVVPDESPNFEGFVVKHWHMPFKNVPGGDFIDYIKVDDEHLIVILGDVMGKRWGAWYFAIAYAGYVRSAVRMVLESTKNLMPSEILKKVNDAVFRDERISEVFITLSVVVINSKTRRALYGGAGDLPIICKGDNVTSIKSKGLLLGFSKEGDYKDFEIDLKSGNEIFLITDGIIESRNKDGKMLGQEGLVNIISEIDPDKESFEMFKKSIINFTGDDFEDDVSFVFIKSL